jgi:hypothetical protein
MTQVIRGRSLLAFTITLAAVAMMAGLGASNASASQHTTGDVRGATIQNIQFDTTLDGIGDGEFVGRIVGLRVDEQGLASGRIIGQLLDSEGNVVQRVNEAFEGFDITGLLNGNGNQVCQILFLELGPVFLDVLGLIVEIPDPVIVEIRAEPGPGQLLGNLLCPLLGILD